MGQKKRNGSAKAKANSQVSNDSESFEQRVGKLARLRTKFTAVGKEEWWWVMDETGDELARQLREHSFAVLDGFFLPSVADEIYASVSGAYKDGSLSEVTIVNGKSGEAEVNHDLRGDLVKWADSDDPNFGCLQRYSVLLGTLVTELSDRIDELKTINSHSKCMATCYPPGARYTAHVDHDGKNESTKSRRLTCITYLNPTWKPGNGGELAIFEPATLQDQSSLSRPPLAKVAPLHNRLVLFFPDWRVPHEVLAATVPRFALTTWFTESAVYAPGERKEFSMSEVSADFPKCSAASAPKPQSAAQTSSTSPAQDATPSTEAVERNPAGAGYPSAAQQADTSTSQTAVAPSDSTYGDARWLLADDGAELSFQLDVPWATSMQDLDLDIAAHAVRILRTKDDASQVVSGEREILIDFPVEYSGKADVANAVAAFSKRKQRLTVKFTLQA